MPHKNKNNPAHIQWSFLHTFGPSWKLNIGSQMYPQDAQLSGKYELKRNILNGE